MPAQPVRYILSEFIAYDGSVAPSEFFPEIHYTRVRHLPVRHSLIHRPQPKLTAHRFFIALHRWGGRSQYHTGTLKPCALYRRLSGMRLRWIIAFIATLMLLIDNYQASPTV